MRIFNKGRKRVKSVCPECGNFKWYDSIMCQKCRYLNIHHQSLERTLDDAALKGNARIKWSYVRKVAHRVLRYEKRAKKCQICNFDIVVDVCHVRFISDFPGSALLKQVNSSANLLYLCPNHHAMLDRGKLSLAAIV